jgi:hypothetical protein
LLRCNARKILDITHLRRAEFFAPHARHVRNTSPKTSAIHTLPACDCLIYSPLSVTLASEIDCRSDAMRKLAKKRDSAKDAADYGAPRPFHHNAGPITGGLVSRPRPGLSDRSRSGDARRALAVAMD